MRKLQLRIDELAVDSFATHARAAEGGTVAARSETYDNFCATAVETYCGETAAGTACVECEQTVMVLTCRATGLQCCENEPPTNGTGPICCNYTNGTGSVCCP